VGGSNPPWPTFLLKKVVRASRRRREGGRIKSTLTLLNKKWLEHPAEGGRVGGSNPPWPTFLLKKVVRASRRRREGGRIKSTLTH